MKSKHIAAMYLTLLAGLFSACSDNDRELAPEGEHPKGSIVLRISTETPMQTRTTMQGSHNRHHVQQVYAILYSGSGDAADYVSHQELDWNPMNDANYGDGLLQKKEFEMVVPAGITSDNEYTLLCVGLDDESGSTYGLTLNADAVPEFCATGKKLADAKASLAEGKAMTRAELFAGWETFTYSKQEVNAVDVRMNRRVAGTYAYLKDIPAMVQGREVMAIRLMLGNLPPTQIGLARKVSEKPSVLPDDFGSNPTTDEKAKVLDLLNLAEIATANKSTNLYEIKQEYTNEHGLQPQTLLLGAYLLPMKAGDESTMFVELLDDSGNVIKAFPTEWTDAPSQAASKDKYSFYPNYLYHVGTHSEKEDRPASLDGERIELVVQPWNEVTINTDFPIAPINAKIIYGKNPSMYIYDCINTRDSITIQHSILKRGWRLTVAAENHEGGFDPEAKCDWIYFEKPDGTITQEYLSTDYTDGDAGEENVKIYIRLNDYVVKRDYNPSTPDGQKAINTDWRRARIILQTDESNSPVHLSFRQYNAITIKGICTDGAAIKHDYECGFSRFDMGVERDSCGDITTQGVPGIWGFWSSAYYQVYPGYETFLKTQKPDYDGVECYEKASENGKGFVGSLIQKTRYDAYEWNGTKNTKDEHYWYLPSRRELFSFFNDVVRKKEIDTHVEDNKIYWSATANHSNFITPAYEVKSYCQQTNKIDEFNVIKRKDKFNDGDDTTATKGYARRARKF